jgi:hypothetical protein
MRNHFECITDKQKFFGIFVYQSTVHILKKIPYKDLHTVISQELLLRLTEMAFSFFPEI